MNALMKAILTQLALGRSHDDELEDDIGDGHRFGGVAQGRTLFFVGEVTESLVQRTMQQLLVLADLDNKAPIYMVVNTQGGDLHEAFALYDTMKFVSPPIRTIGMGKIMSAGCLILSAGERGYRRIGKNATLMYHSAWGGTMGSQWEQETDLIEFKRLQQQYDSLISAETGKTLAEVQALHAIDRVDRYLTPEQAIAFGFADLLV